MFRFVNLLIALVSLSLPPEGVAMVPQVFPYYVCHGGDSIFWTDFFGGSLYQAPLQGGNSEKLFSLDPALGEKLSFTVADKTHIFFATSGTPKANYADGRILRFSRTQKRVETFASNQNGVAGLTLDAENLYWTTRNSVVKAGKKSGKQTILVADENYPKGIVVDSQAVYWASGKEKGIRKLSHGESKSVNVAVDQEDPDLVALDSESVYWTNSRAGYQIRKTKKDQDGELQEIAKTASGAKALAVWKKNVYWTTADGWIWRYVAATSKVDKVSRAIFQQYDPALTSLAVSDQGLYWVEIEKKMVKVVPAE